MSKKRKKYYVVIRGYQPGIYDEWYGETGAQAQVNGFPNALYKGFSTSEDAEEWFKLHINGKPPNKTKRKESLPPVSSCIRTSYNSSYAASSHSNGNRNLKKFQRDLFSDSSGMTGHKVSESSPELPKVMIYTDGGCLCNPGPGGYGVILIYGKHRKELSGGFRLTTNNRMELFACIVGLKRLKSRCSVLLHSDSKYVVDGISKGWAKKWQANNWMRNSEKRAKNADLWAELLDLCSQHDVRFIWVKGHAGHPENERCDQLASDMARHQDLLADMVYEMGET